MGLLAGSCLLVALALTWVGAWLVLPFAGVEVALLVWAFRQVAKGDRDFESLSVTEGVFHYQARHGDQMLSAQGALAWLGLEQGRQRGGPRLGLRYAGRVYPVGTFLTDRQCLALEQDLQALIGTLRRESALDNSRR